ncbi:MAG TPA: hypothetical protein VN915_05125 [Elusimicrobiota bacterium]|nr:hypothetical protein [Elusimicrobiota bacterium]
MLAGVLLFALAVPGSCQLQAAEARPASAFPADYLRSISLSISAQPFYASQLLNSFHAQLTAVAAIPAAPDAAKYLESAATGGKTSLAAMRAEVGRAPLAPEKASAILIANSLARPEQFREVMDGLETLKPGLGRRAADALRSVSGPGSGKVIAALRAAGERRPQGEGLTYGPDGRWATMFDGSPAPRDDGAEAVQASPPDAAARARLPALSKPR